MKRRIKKETGKKGIIWTKDERAQWKKVYKTAPPKVLVTRKSAIRFLTKKQKKLEEKSKKEHAMATDSYYIHSNIRRGWRRAYEETEAKIGEIKKLVKLLEK